MKLVENLPDFSLKRGASSIFINLLKKLDPMNPGCIQLETALLWTMKGGNIGLEV